MEFVGKIEYGFDLRGEETEYAFIEVPMVVADLLSAGEPICVKARAFGYSNMPWLKIFLDDRRSCPEGLILCQTAEQAMKLIGSGFVFYISFDHDLGKGLNGHDVATYIERCVEEGTIKCPEWDVHTSNPEGRRRINLAMQSAKRIDEDRQEHDNIPI